MAYFSKIDVLIDNPDSWIWEYESEILRLLSGFTKQLHIYKDMNLIDAGDILFLLSCNRLLPENILSRHINNIIVHESDLPKGKGWSPLSWQVEAGYNEIPITLFEAAKKVDNGAWYLKDKIILSGYELIDEIREKQLRKTLEMIDYFLKNYPMFPKPQKGDETFYPKRNFKHQELDINATIMDMFNKLRVCDNERYPAHFYINNKKYIFKIYRE